MAVTELLGLREMSCPSVYSPVERLAPIWWPTKGAGDRVFTMLSYDDDRLHLITMQSGMC
jgi:hypothetical protein